MFHLRASNEIERQRWVTALELAKAKAISYNMVSRTVRVYICILNAGMYLQMIILGL